MSARRRAGPVSDGEFSQLMARFAPFDDCRHLAVAVSGGPDSLALALLAARWANDNGHTVTALTVDHGLRPESAAEAGQVADWFAGRGLAHEILRWRGAKPVTAVQATARAARYRLLLRWCRINRGGDLLVGHQLEDQAETLLMRLARGSGLDGLAAMAPAGRLGGVRLVRPLLAIPRARLRETLEALGQPWIEDPSNLDPAFLRTQAGRALALLSDDRSLPGRLGVTASRLARARAALDAFTEDFVAAAVTIGPAGFALIDLPAWFAAPDEIALRGLAVTLTCVSGADAPPRLERLEQLCHSLCEGRIIHGRTLHGCRIRAYRGRLLVCRETRGVAAHRELTPGRACRWDSRFLIGVRARAGRAVPGGLTVGALGKQGLGQIALAIDYTAPPAPVRPSLPAVWAGERLVAVPHFDYVAPSGAAWLASARAEFRPPRPISPKRHVVTIVAKK